MTYARRMTRVSVLGGSPAVREAVASAPWRDAAGITLTDITPDFVIRIDHSGAPSPVHEIRLKSAVADDVLIVDPTPTPSGP